MMVNFDGDRSLADLISCIKDIYNNTDDSLFKFEKLGDTDKANVVVTQDGEQKCAHNEKNYDNRTPENANQNFLTHHIDIMINDIIKGTVCESEV